MKRLLILLIIPVLYTCIENPVGVKPPDDPFWLTFPEGGYFDPAWHPDGSFIAFNFYPWTNNSDIIDEYAGFWRINPDGTGMQKMFPFRLLYPSWSPDGEWLVFQFRRKIIKMRYDGAAFDTTQASLLSDEGFYPSYSYDGSLIIFDYGAGIYHDAQRRIRVETGDS